MPKLLYFQQINIRENRQNHGIQCFYNAPYVVSAPVCVSVCVCAGLLSYPFCPDDYPADFRISQLRFVKTRLRFECDSETMKVEERTL